MEQYAPRGDARPVDYFSDCYDFEPINWLYPDSTPEGAWREETWALELFFKGPDGERGGQLFYSVRDEPALTCSLDKIALLSLRKAVLEKLLALYPGLMFSMNVTAATLSDCQWFQNFISDFARELGKRGAQHRVIFEIQEHPTDAYKRQALDQNALQRQLHFLRHSKIRFAIDDAYTPGYVFQMIEDALDGVLVWQKMDWRYFQETAVNVQQALVSGITRALRRPELTLVIEGVENDLLKSFLVKEVLQVKNIPRLSIQSRRTELHLTARKIGDGDTETPRATKPPHAGPKVTSTTMKPWAAAAACAALVFLAIVITRNLPNDRRSPEVPPPPSSHHQPSTIGHPPSIAAALEIHFQRKGQLGSYQILSADSVPLQTGDRIQIHAYLPQPLHAYLFSASSNGATRLLHPPPAEESSPVKEIHIPIRRDEWFELSPPAGTETILLLARHEPLKDVEAFRNELLSFGPPPALDGLGLLVVDESTPRLVSPKKERPLGDKPVKVEKGFLDLLLKQVPDQWPVVRGLAFPHQSPGEPQNKETR